MNELTAKPVFRGSEENPMKGQFSRWAGIALAFVVLPGIVDPVAADSVSTRTEPGTVFREALRSGGEGPKMVVLPAGSFRMGCLSDDKDCTDHEKPVHEVRIARPFAVSVYEVTVEDYARFRPDMADKDKGRHPAPRVSWEDAKAYVSWLSRETGAEYRLLSESEWEYAARAGSVTKYSWGDGIESDRANCNKDCVDGYSETAPVGSFMPNGFGLYDMHGNVWEWVEDCWPAGYDSPYRLGDGSAQMRGDCKGHVVRGGGWLDTPWDLRSAYRGRYPAGRQGALTGYGIRVARTLTP